ncbi:MAG: hypothetical protein QOD75_1978 [Blastocatellia bacterium]|jgi:hypothetical protein|nr:hypothetical protein [Blastocatellia bacterium]
MPDSAVTLRHVFEVPEPSGGEESPETWKRFREKLTEEIKGVKVASMPDMAGKIGELLDIPIPGIFLNSWRKADALQKLLEESKRNPEAIMDLELADHTINSEHRPSIELRVHNATVKKIEFTLRLVFSLKGCVLRVQHGVIKEMRAGMCDVKGQMEYGGLTILEKKVAPLHFPGVISFHREAE